MKQTLQMTEKGKEWMEEVKAVIENPPQVGQGQRSNNRTW